MQRTAVSAPWSNTAHPGLVGQILEPPRAGRPDRVDECVDFAPRRVDLPEGGGDLVVLRRIGREGEDCVRPGRLHRPLRRLEASAVTAEDGDAPTSSGEALATARPIPVDPPLMTLTAPAVIAFPSGK